MTREMVPRNVSIARMASGQFALKIGLSMVNGLIDEEVEGLHECLTEVVVKGKDHAHVDFNSPKRKLISGGGKK